MDFVVPRLQSLFIEPGYFSFFIEGTFFISLAYLSMVKPGRKRIFIKIGIFIQLLAIILSLSFAGIVFVPIVYLFYAVTKSNKPFLKAFIFKTLHFIFYFGSFLTILYLLKPDLVLGVYKIIFVDHFSAEKDVSSADVRKDVFFMGLQLFLKNPILGIGYNQIRVVSDGDGTNNSYLTVAAELGIIGLFLYFIIIFLLFRISTRLVKFTRLYSQNCIAIASALVYSFIIQTVHLFIIDGSWTFQYWITISLLVSFYNLKRRQLLASEATSQLSFS